MQSMRSWSTLQPGEVFSCVGCHSDNKHDAPRLIHTSLAMQAGVQPLDPVYGPPEGFSFQREVQPILDRNCVSCHDGKNVAVPINLTGNLRRDEQAKRYWSDSYLALTWSGEGEGRKAPDEGPVRWIQPQSAPQWLPPYYTGASKSPLIKMLEEGHRNVELSPQEIQTIALWIDLAVPFVGDYSEANAWSEGEHAKYIHFLEKRMTMEAIEAKNIEALIKKRTRD